MAETVGGTSSSVAYGYDALYRLTAEQRTGAYSGGHTFGYDLAGNMTARDSAAATYDAANKITLSGFAYDGDGNLTGDGASAYAWDDRGDMTGRTGGGMTTSYGYDARGLRVVSQVGLGTKTFYVFAGDTLVGEVNGAGVAQAAYTWGAAGLVSERLIPSGRSLWYHFGPQGETRQLTDSSGTVADSYVYSAYGQPVASTGTDANPFRFGGRHGCYTDGAAVGGLVLCTYRWYDPNNSRWLSRDPIGYEGGDNLYGYCLNNPVTRVDPVGLLYIDVGGNVPVWGWGGVNIGIQYDPSRGTINVYGGVYAGTPSVNVEVGPGHPQPGGYVGVGAGYGIGGGVGLGGIGSGHAGGYGTVGLSTPGASVQGGIVLPPIHLFPRRGGPRPVPVPPSRPIRPTPPSRHTRLVGPIPCSL